MTLNPDANVLVPGTRSQRHAVRREAERCDAILVTAEHSVVLDLHGVPDVDVVVVRAAHDEATAQGERWKLN